MLFLNKNNQAMVSQEHFLNNNSNKKLLINMIREKCAEVNIETFQAKEDDDFLSVDTVIKKGNSDTRCFIIGEDIDLLLLLTHYSEYDSNVFIKKLSRDYITTFYIWSNKLKRQKFKKCDFVCSFI